MQQSNKKFSRKERVLITGNAGALGRALVDHLALDERLHLIGVDRRPFDQDQNKIEHYALDLRRKSAIQTLARIKPHVIIHLGVIRNPQTHRRKKANAYYFNLESTTQLLLLAESLKIKKFIFLSTANLYGPSAMTSGLLTEDTPLHGADKSPEFRDLVSLDMMVQSFFWKQPKTKTIILRPSHIVGPTLRNAPTRFFQLETIPTILGFDPMIQLLHVSDLINAIKISLDANERGIFNLAGTESAPLSRIIAALVRPTIPLPYTLLKGFAAGSFLSNRSSFPAAELDHLKYSCLIDDARARNVLKYQAKVNLLAIIDELCQQFRRQHPSETKAA